MVFSQSFGRETFEKCSFFFKFKEGENFNHRCPAGNALGVNTLSISRIKLKLHFVHNVETNSEIGQKGAFCKGLGERLLSRDGQSIFRKGGIRDNFERLNVKSFLKGVDVLVF